MFIHGHEVVRETINYQLQMKLMGYQFWAQLLAESAITGCLSILSEFANTEAQFIVFQSLNTSENSKKKILIRE